MLQPRGYGRLFGTAWERGVEALDIAVDTNIYIYIYTHKKNIYIYICIYIQILIWI